MYTDSLLLKKTEDRQNKTMDWDYLREDICIMVPDLNITNSNKDSQRGALRKFKNRLFSGGLGDLKNFKPSHIKLKPGAIPYKARYYNLLKTYKHSVKKARQCMVDIGVLP